MAMLSAKTWGGRPSEYLDPTHQLPAIIALLLDEALAIRAIQERAQASAAGPDPEVVEAGSRYESPADWGVPLHDPAHHQTARSAFRALRQAEAGKVH